MVEEPTVARVSAQGLMEYGLIIALVAVLAIAGPLLFGPQLTSLLSPACWLGLIGVALRAGRTTAWWSNVCALRGWSSTA